MRQPPYLLCTKGNTLAEKRKPSWSAAVDVSGSRRTGRNAAHRPPRRGDSVSWLTILIIVLVVLLVLGFFGRGRYRA